MWRSDGPATLSTVLGVCMGLGLQGGCTTSVGPKSDAVERAAAIQSLEKENAALREELDVLRDRMEASDIPVDPSLLPRPVSVVEARGSAVRLEGDTASLQWRVRSEDRRGRMVQTTGPARVMAACFAADGTVVSLGRWDIPPDAWLRSLREGLLGGSYAIDLPLEQPLPPGAKTVQVRLELEDPRLVDTLELDSIVPVIRRASPEDRT